MKTNEVNIGGDYLDVRDIIARVKELREERETFVDDDKPDHEAVSWDEGDDGKELALLESALDELKGCGGDEQWEGEWYPVTLIHANSFVDAMKELVSDIGDLPRDIPAYLVIDWDETAENLRADYSSIDIGDSEYWYR